MGAGALGVHGAIVQLPVVAHNRIEQGVAIHLGQLKMVHLVLGWRPIGLSTKTAMFKTVVSDILATLDTLMHLDTFARIKIAPKSKKV